MIFNYDSSYFDVIVICAGHNDLTYTCNLTKAGLKVLVLEEYHTLECTTITEELSGFSFKSDVHAFGYWLVNFPPVPSVLKLNNYGFKLIYSKGIHIPYFSKR